MAKHKSHLLGLGGFGLKVGGRIWVPAGGHQSGFQSTEWMMWAPSAPPPVGKARTRQGACLCLLYHVASSLFLFLR